MKLVVCHGLLLQCAFHAVSAASMRAVTLRNSTQAALAAREALRADLDSQTTSGEDFEAFIQACDRSADSERAVDRIGLHESSYSKNRKDQQYYRDTWCAVRFLGEGARSIVDVGSSFPPFLMSTDWIPEREITSKYFPGNEKPCGAATTCTLQDGIQANIQDFYTWHPDKVYDVVIAMQVVEHVSNPTRFMRKLLKTGRTVVVTVPYKWDDHHMEFHKHHKIALEDMRQWAGKHELHFHVSQDTGKGQYSQRLLMVFQGEVEKASEF
jgi:hypothetical protein